MAKIDLRPARLDYRVVRGDDFADVVTIQEGDPAAPVDVSARTYTAQVRRTADGAIVASFSIDMTAAASGEVGYSLADTTTDDLSGEYVWDFQQSVAGVVRTLMGGKFVVYADVTHA